MGVEVRGGFKIKSEGSIKDEVGKLKLVHLPL